MDIVFYFSNLTLERDPNTTGFSYTQNYYKDLNPVDDNIKLSIQWDLELSNTLKTHKNENIKVQLVNDDATNYFTGYVRKTVSFSKTQKNEDISIELVSPSFLLDVDTKEPITITECRIETAITRLLAQAGFTAAKNISVDAVIPYFFVPDGENIADTLTELCKEYGYTYRFDADGYFYLCPLFNAPGTITQIFDGGNTFDEIKQELKEEEADGVCASWSKLAYVENTLLFKDTQNGDATYACKIQVAPESWLFGKVSNYCNYDSELGTVKFTTSAYPLFVHDDQIEVMAFENLGTKALVSAYNHSSTGQYRFTKFEIYGNAYIEVSSNTDTVANGTKKNQDIDIKYLFDETKVLSYVTSLTNWYRYADITVSLKSKTDYPLGSFCTVEAYGAGTLTGRIIQKKITLLDSNISYTIEGISDFVPAVITSTTTKRASSSYITASALTNYRTETRYTRSADKPATPTGTNPEGWTITVPTGDDIIWMTAASFNFDGTIATTWYEPTRFSSVATAIGQLTSDSATVYFDDNGVGDYTSISTSLLIYEAGKNSTATWVYGAIPSAGVTGTLSANTFTVLNLSTDTGYVDLTASRSGMDTITKRFILTKSSKGTQDIYNMSASSAVIVIRDDGTCSPEAVNFSATVAHGTAGNTSYTGIYKLYVDDDLLFTSEPESAFTLNAYDFYPFPSTHKFPSVLSFPNDALINNDILRVRVELWDENEVAKLDSQSLTITKDIGISMAEILDSNASSISDALPKYLGKYLDSIPTEYKVGDWFLIYGMDDIPFQRGVYLVKSDMTLERLTGDADESSKFIYALPDITAVSNAGYGDVLIYGQITYFSNIASNSAFTQSLIVQNTNLGQTIIDGGKIKADLIDAEKITGVDAVFRGTLQAAGGTFSGSLASGGLSVDVSPPTSSSFTTTGKIVSVFVDEIMNSGIAQGRYACAGNYDSKVLAAIKFTKSGLTVLSSETYSQYTYTGTRVKTGQTPNGMGGYFNVYSCEYVRTDWKRDTTKIDYTVSFEDADGVATALNGTLKPSNSWYSVQSGTGWTTGWIPIGGWPSDTPAPTGETPESDTSTTLASGSINFTAASFTMKIKNLPAYSSSLASGTVFFIDTGADYYTLGIKK